METVKISHLTNVEEIKVYKYRWVVLIIFVLVCMNSFMAELEFSIIANVITEYYNVSEFLVDLSCLVFFIAYVTFFYPISFLIERHSLKFTLVSAMALTLAGNLLKLLATKPDRFWIILLAQALIAIGQVYILSIPSKVATTWFGSKEVSTACACGVFGLQLGSALSCVISPNVIIKDTEEKMESELFQKFLYQAIATGIIFGLVLIFFRSKPDLPPSKSQLKVLTSGHTEILNHFSDTKVVIRNKNFWLVVASLGMANAIWCSTSVLQNLMYTHYFPNEQTDAGNIGLLTILAGGCLASMTVGVILDKTHRFKTISLIILICSALSYGGVLATLTLKSRIGTYITIPLFGFFLAPVLIVSLEYLVELTYPIPEACSSSVFIAIYNLISVILTYVFEEMMYSLGYFSAFVIIIVILIACAVIVLFVKSDLKRRDANLLQSIKDKGIETASINQFTHTVSTVIY